ncbi:diacylglycerol kinase [Enterococcus florum]|uniref:Diacylglycerol kinase n=1 Tax=Enterococcus florum TaxID=2480627 RepID=A0A4P5PA53_9ENTE|nr:diacylglycerol kinase [Enterococcus florum]GCF94506.1 diacylglycerol kinase [Enterococcus florum]
MKKARLIYNPVSGKEIMRNNLADILDTVEKAGYETSAFATTPEPDSAKKEAYRAAEAGFDLVIAAGGDGTINEVVNGIAPLPTRPKMAIIPAGTTNDYARALKIPRNNVKAAAEVLLKQQTVKMDIGKAHENYFINIAAGGYLTELTYEVPSELKSIFGYLAYLAKGAEMLPRIKPIKMRLKYEGGEYEGNASMFFLGLTNSIGGFETIAPDAMLDDGKFSLIVVKTANLFEIVRLITLVLNGGKHVNDPKVLYVKTNFLEASRLDGNQRMMINLDGEYGGDAPMRFENLHQHIEFFANTDEISNDAILGIELEEKEAGAELVKEYKKLEEKEEYEE